VSQGERWNVIDCRDFERAWNERFDVRDAAPAGLERALEAHAAACPSCRALGARYQRLGQAIRTLGPLPAAPAGFADRVLAAAGDVESRPSSWRIVVRLVPLAAAAAVLAAAVLGLRTWMPRRVPPRAPGAAVAQVRAINPEDLTEALADATSATWDLAREASAPAARVGRQVLSAAELPGTHSPLVLPASVAPSAEVWQRVGDRVNAGVRPLKGTARHAFGFLLGPSSDDPGPPPHPRSGA